MSDLSQIWEDLSDAERQSLGTVLAGKNQYKVLASVMTNFATATNATTTALNSSGSAAEENAKYLESIEARVTAVSAAFQQMALKTIDSDLVKGILDIAKAFAEFGTTDFGSGITQLILLSGVSWGGLQLLGNSILPGIISSFKSLSAILSAGSLVTAATGAGVSTLTMGLSASLPIIMGVVGGLLLLVSVIKSIKAAYDEAHPSIEELRSAMNTAQEELKSAETKYEQVKLKLEELNAVPYVTRTAEMQDEIEELQILIEYYEQLLNAKQQQAIIAAKRYASKAEEEGFHTGKWTVHGAKVVDTSIITGPAGDATTINKYEKYIIGAYNSIDAAIAAAAADIAKNRGIILDLSDMEKAKTQLEAYHFSFEESIMPFNELATNVKAFREYIAGEYLTGDEVSVYLDNIPILRQGYEDLISAGKEYAGALKNIPYEELTSEQKQFLSDWEGMISNWETFIKTIGEAGIPIDEQSQAIINASSALGDFARNCITAGNAYEIFKSILEQSGDYDEGFKGLTSVFAELNGEWEKGQVGSVAFLTALELITGKSFTSAEAVNYMNQNLDVLNLLFGNSESGGMGLISAMQLLSKDGSLAGASIEDLGDSLSISVSSFSDLADSLGISEGALYQLTKALKVMGIDISYNIPGLIDDIAALGEGIVGISESSDGVQKTTVDFDKFVQSALAAGRSRDEILQIAEVLSDASGVELTNVESGMEALGNASDDATDSANDLNGALDDVGSASGGIDTTASSVSTLSDNLSTASSHASTLYSSLSKISNLKFPSFSFFGHAEGTSFAEEGNSLVNEEGPELIQSKDKAYIAGKGLPTITYLHKGDRVYTAEQTKNILKNKNIDGAIPAHAAGFNLPHPPTGISTLPPLIINKNLLKDLPTTDTSTPSSDASKETKESKEEKEKTTKEEFDEWLKAKKHALAMDEITEREYYEELEKMNEKYFKDSEEYLEEYWKYQEEVYKWRKKQQEEENEEIEKQIELQKKLEEALGEVAKAKSKKILVYKDGKFQYIQDIDAISEAQRKVEDIKSGYASGTTNASAGLHLVGENGPELRVLNKGDGILSSDITKNLLNLARWNFSDLLGGLNKSFQTFYSFNIDNLSLPNVQDGESFLNGLKNYAYQYSYS